MGAFEQMTGPVDRDSHFIIYYLNYPKTVELAMTFGSTLQTGHSVVHLAENSNGIEGGLTANVSAGSSLISKAELSSSINGKLVDTESYKVAETYQVKHTKSTYLDEVMRHVTVIDAQSISDSESLHKGELVRIDDVALSMLHYSEFLPLSMLRHDFFKGMQVDGVDINNVISSILEDYSYVLIADMKNRADTNTSPNPDTDGQKPSRLAIKIPSESSNEFESKYRIHDLLLGEVSLVGVYKGTVALKTLAENTFTLLQDSSGTNSEAIPRIIKSSRYDERPAAAIRSEEPLLNDLVHYIDLLAIIQPITTGAFENNDDSEDESGKAIGRWRTWLRKCIHRG
jgi:hypothetical protein